MNAEHRVSSQRIGSMYRVDTFSALAEMAESHLSGVSMSQRGSGVLEFAVLGLLHESPMHGYELRKRLSGTLGTMRAFSYGSLYPCLKQLTARGWIVESADSKAVGRRSKIVYQLTAEGKEHFQDLLAEAGPGAWEDDTFGVRLAFFGRTDADTRMRILVGRRGRLEERLDNVKASLGRTRERLDGYTLELQQHGLESVEREVRWLNELIDDERKRENHAEASMTSATTPSAAGTSNDRATAPGDTK